MLIGEVVSEAVIESRVEISHASSKEFQLRIKTDSDFGYGSIFSMGRPDPSFLSSSPVKGLNHCFTSLLGGQRSCLVGRICNWMIVRKFNALYVSHRTRGG